MADRRPLVNVSGMMQEMPSGDKVPIAAIATGTPDGTKFVRDDGTLAAPSGGGLPTLVVVSGTTQTAAAGNHYVLTNASATTVTLPASPAAGDVVVITVANGRMDNVIDRNGKEINGVAENMTIDFAYGLVWLRYIDGTLQWRTW